MVVRYRITVNRAGLEDGTADKPIRAENIASGIVWDYAEVVLLGDSRIVYRPDMPLRDGARVWIEAGGVLGVR